MDMHSLIALVDNQIKVKLLMSYKKRILVCVCAQEMDGQ